VTRLPFATALVTGASSGIGRALALELGRRGVAVALAARRRPELETLAAEIERVGTRAVVLPADLAEPAEGLAVVAAAEAALGRLDLVIANAGVGGNAPVAEQAWNDIERMVRVNVLGALAVVRAALPAMLARSSGAIAGISSLASFRGLPRAAAYSASKAALSTFLESARVECHGRGVSVTDVHPGYVRSEMTAGRGRRMPFLMDADRAARLILRAIVRRRAVYSFPWQMALLLGGVRMLPPWLFDRLLAGRAERTGAREGAPRPPA
jgi:short-subunit dehydrogenase